MTKRTRRFLFVATGILVVGLGTGLVASYMGGLPGLNIIGSNGPAELAYLPADTQMVAFANVGDIMNSELRQKLMQFQPGAAEGADRFQQETGINIQTDVDHVVAAVSADSLPNGHPLVLIRGRFNPSNLESLARDKGAVVEEYKGKRLITHGEAGMGLVFVEPNLVAVGAPAALRRAIDTKADKSTNVTSNAELMALVDDIDDGNAWAVARLDALAAGPLPADLASQLPPVNWFAASAHIDGGLRGVIHAEARDEKSANDLRDVIRGFIALARLQMGERAEFADLMNSLQLGGLGNKVSLGFAVPSEMIDALGKMHAEQLNRRPAPNRGPRPELPAPPAL